MISTNDFKTGLTIELNGEPCQVVEFQHVKPGKGAAFVRAKIKNLKTGSVTEQTFRAGEKVPKAILDRRQMQYLYNDGENYVFMDNENFEQIFLTKEQLDGSEKYLKENMDCQIVLYQGKVLGIDLPNTVELEVIETEPGIKGDTASGGTKPATLETGVVVQVPFFINTGDILRIDTRSGEYIERA
ncbi:MAG: elongation factor [Clostridia bacterium]|nr:elongation factor [Clostridia bacterium]MDN5323042.1 elongation factor [Clostridia bacterium]